MDNKKGKGKKSKKAVKQQQQKFGFTINLDQQEPDIPVEKTQTVQEQGFKVIYAQQFKQQRPQVKPDQHQLQNKSQTLKISQAQQNQQKPFQAVVTCEQSEQPKKQQLQIKYQYAAIQTLNKSTEQQLKQLQQAPLMVQKSLSNEKQGQFVKKSSNGLQLKADVPVQAKQQAKRQEIIEKQAVKTPLQKNYEVRQLQQEMEQKISIQNKVIKKQNSKLVGSKKKQTKQKSKKSVVASLSLQVQQFEEKVQPLPNKGLENLQKNHITPNETIQKLVQFQEKNEQINQINKEQLSQPKPLEVIAVQTPIENQTKPQIQEKTQIPFVQKQISQKGQIIEAKQNVSITAQVNVQDEIVFESKISDVSSKAVKKVKKGKTSKKQSKTELKLSLQTQSFMVDQIKEEKVQSNPLKQQNYTIQEQLIAPLQVQNEITSEADKKPIFEETNHNIERNLKEIQTSNEIVKQTIKQKKKESQVEQNSNIRQQQIPLVLQVNQPKEEIKETQVTLERDVEIQLFDAEVKVSKVKSSKKQGKKELKNKNSSKVQKEFTMKVQIQQLQVESIPVKEQPKNDTKPEYSIVDTKLQQPNVKSQVQQFIEHDHPFQKAQLGNKAESQQIQQVKQDSFQPSLQLKSEVQNNNLQQQRQSHFWQTVQEFKQVSDQVQKTPEQIIPQQETKQDEKQSNSNTDFSQPNSSNLQNELKIECNQVNLDLDQVLETEKGKLEANKKVAKKTKTKLKPRSNQISMTGLVLQVQQTSSPLETTEAVPHLQQQPPKLLNNQNQLRAIQQKRKQQNEIDKNNFIASIESNTEEKQQADAQQQQRIRQLAFYKKLQQQQSRSNHLEENPFNQPQKQLTSPDSILVTSQQPKIESQNYQIKLNTQESKQKIQNQPSAQIKLRNEEQNEKVDKRQAEQSVINVQEEEFSTKIVLSQVSKQKAKNQKKNTKKAKVKQITTITTALLDINEENTSKKVEIQKQQIAKSITIENKQAQQTAKSEYIPKIDPISAKQLKKVEKIDLLPKLEPLNIAQPIKTIIQEQKDAQELLYKPQISEPKLIKPEKQTLPQSVQKNQSRNSKTGSIVAQLIDLIRFKGDEDMRIARERLNMLQQDVRSRLLRKGRKTIIEQRETESAALYGSIIDQNIHLRQELKNIVNST